MNNRTKIQKEIVESLNNPGHGILLLSPRLGKSKIAIEIIKKEKPSSILWVTPSEKLRDIDIPNEFDLWKAKRYKSRLTCVCWSSLDKIEGYFDKVFLDEYQDLTEHNTQNFFNGKLDYGSIIGLSGTHPKHKKKLDILKKLNLDILVEKTIAEAAKEGIVADYKINVIEVPLNSKDRNIKAGSKAKPFMTTEESNYQYVSKTINRMRYANKDVKFLIIKRMHLIYNSPTKEEAAKFLIDNLKGRKLVFTGSIEQSKRLSPYIFNSKTDKTDLDKFINQEIDILACVKSGGVGFTYKNLDHLIIVQADSDKKGETTQKLARSLLLQKDYKANIWLISLTGTQDEKWINSALSSFDKSKIEYTRFINLKNKL